MNDHGNGTIKLSEAEISTTINGSMSQECKNHLQIGVMQYNMNIKKLNIQLNSNLDYLLESFLGILTDALLDIFNTALEPVIRDIFSQAGNDGFAGSSEISFVV